MKILMATSEAVPFAKTGGLADAVSALSLSLAEAGHDVRIVMPRYYGVDRSALKLLDGPLGVRTGWGEEWCAVYEGELPGGGVPVYFVDHENYFGRDGVYGTRAEPDFADNPRRFGFFSRAVFQVCRKLQWFPDVLHAHDWPTAPTAVFLRYGERSGPFAATSSVLTIHNLGYQGVYDKRYYSYLGLPGELFTLAGFDDWDRMNYLKAGLISADKLTTVSPTYAEETKTAEYGFHLDGVLRARSSDYLGILNGVDYREWNPGTDTRIPATYSGKDLTGKAVDKAELQRRFGLEAAPEIPIIGMVTRLTDQKGIGAVFGPGHGSAYSMCSDFRIQFVLLGSGERWCEDEIRALSDRLPNFRGRIGYDEGLSHLIESGSDFFLMPSRYEPCGLNQLYSLSYGTPPIVRRTGGLADTVENFDEATGSGVGFVFDELTPRAIYDTVGWAVWAYYNRRPQVEAMRVRGMALDYSWTRSAARYAELYASLVGAT